MSTAASAQVVTVQAHVTDDLAGTDCVFIVLIGPGGQLIQNGCATRTSGDALDGTYALDLVLPRYAQSGTWKIQLDIADEATNSDRHSGGTVTVTS